MRVIASKLQKLRDSLQSVARIEFLRVASEVNANNRHPDVKVEGLRESIYFPFFINRPKYLLIKLGSFRQMNKSIDKTSKYTICKVPFVPLLISRVLAHHIKI